MTTTFFGATTVPVARSFWSLPLTERRHVLDWRSYRYENAP